VGIDRNALDSDFVVQVRRGDAPGCADVSDDLATANVLARSDGEAGEVSVAGGYAVSMIEGDEAPVAAGQVGEADDAVGGGVNGSSVGYGDINPTMERAFTVEGIDTLAE